MLRVRLPFIGTLLRSYTPGTVPSFDPNDKMKVADDFIDPHGYRVLMDTFDFDEGTVEIEVRVEPLARIELDDGTQVWEGEDYGGKIPLKIVGEEAPADYDDRALIEEAKVSSSLSGKDASTILSESRLTGVYIDSRSLAVD